MHALKALAAGNRDEVEMIARNVEVSHVGPEGFKTIDEAELEGYLAQLENVSSSII